MAKKCIICSEKAGFKIKDGSEFYCEECAEEHFADLSLLQKIEEARTVRTNGISQDDQDRED